jgi:hypothetical protein
MTTSNKLTSKAIVDGVELTWNADEPGEMDAEKTAKFYTDSVAALQKFKGDDPRTEPKLRAEKKKNDKAGVIFWTIVWTFILTFMVIWIYQTFETPRWHSR